MKDRSLHTACKPENNIPNPYLLTTSINHIRFWVKDETQMKTTKQILSLSNMVNNQPYVAA